MKKLGHELGFDFENCLSFLIICWWIWFFIHFVGFVDTLWLTWGEYQTLDTKLTQYQTRVNCLGWIESLIHQVQIYRDVDYPIHMVWSWRTKMYQRLDAPVEFAPWKSSSELLDKVKLQNFVFNKSCFQSHKNINAFITFLRNMTRFCSRDSFHLSPCVKYSTVLDLLQSCTGAKSYLSQQTKD